MTQSSGPQGVELSVVHTGDVPTPYGYVFRAQGNALSRLRAGLTVGHDALISPCVAFVLRHPLEGLMLVDTGFHSDARTNLRKDFAVPMNLLFRRLRPAPEPFDAQLRALRIAPEAVRSVVMTHLHVDHTSGMRLLPQAEFMISRTEWRATRGRFAAARGYARHHLPPEERVKFLDLERDGEPWGPFHATLDLLGDDTIRLLSTPGHTKGHLSLLVRLSDGRRVLLVGDAAYTLLSIREEILPMLTVDDHASRRSLRELKLFTEQDQAAIVVPSHDSEAWRALEGIAAPISSGARGT